MLVSIFNVTFQRTRSLNDGTSDMTSWTTGVVFSITCREYQDKIVVDFNAE